jgi:hypothetical protein
MMKITRNVVPITDLYQWLDGGTLVINHDYQRGTGLWPVAARSYFIDTILNEFPFPKITIRQSIDVKQKGVRREVVDGQQRLTTIRDFIDNKLRLTSTSKKFTGKRFCDLDEEIQQAFLAYEVSVDLITIGSTDEVLETFRRMNSYTLKLNEPEKRHATYQGRFKWFILELLDDYTAFLEKAGVLTIKEIGRMLDADLMTELCQVALYGIEDRSSDKLNNIYKKNDIPEGKFEFEDRCTKIVTVTLDYMKDNMMEMFRNNTEVPAYFFYSIFTALVFNKYGIIGINDGADYSIPYQTINKYSNDIEYSVQKIGEMLRAAEDRDENSSYGEFVRACSSSTHRVGNRRIRLKWLVTALQAIPNV